jgi:hypothetical protein
VSFVAQVWPIEAVLAFGAEGTGGCTSVTKVQRSQKRCAPAGNISSGAGGSTGEMSREARRDRSKILGSFGAEGAALHDTWLLRTCKEGTIRGGDKGCRV